MTDQQKQAFEIVQKVCDGAVKAGLLNTTQDAAQVHAALQILKPKEEKKTETAK